MRTTLFYPATLLAMSLAGQAHAAHLAQTEVHQAIELSQTDATSDSAHFIADIMDKVTGGRKTQAAKKEAEKKAAKEKAMKEEGMATPAMRARTKLRAGKKDEITPEEYAALKKEEEEAPIDTQISVEAGQK